jgi:hypothetical protein
MAARIKNVCFLSMLNFVQLDLKIVEKRKQRKLRGGRMKKPIFN